MNNNHHIYDKNMILLQFVILLFIYFFTYISHLQMQLLSVKIDKNDTYVTTVTKTNGELGFTDDEEDSFFTKVIFLCIITTQEKLILVL